MTKDKSKITVILGGEEFERFSAYCAAQGFKKSTLIARLIRELLDREQFQIQGKLPLDEGIQRS